MRRFLSLALIATAVLLVPQAASAATRYAAPGGLMSGNCTSPDTSDLVNGPCYFPHAVAQAQNGETVEVFEGTHDLGSGTADTFGKTNVLIRGAPGQGVPRLVSTGAVAIITARVDVTVRRLILINNGTGYGVGTFGGTIEQVYAQSSSNGGAACRMEGADAILRDTVCRDVSGTSFAAGLVAELSAGTVTDTLRNVTAIATGAGTFGIRVRAPNAGALLTVNAANVIARGGAADVRVEAGNMTSSATANLTYSNYTTVSEANGPGTEAVTDPPPGGSPTNQSAAPLFADAAAGDFHQLFCSPSVSPTVDAGIVDANTGTADFEGDPRQIGSAVDIGADEATLNCPPPPVEPEPGDTAAPDTQITAGPEGKTRKRTATFSFSGSDARVVASFQCKLDSGSFETCTSPKSYSGLKRGSHTFSVRAVDAAGNVDPSPATRTWKVKKKRKRR